MAFRDENPTFGVVRFEPTQQPDTRSFLDGSMWYDTSAKAFKGVINGTVSAINGNTLNPASYTFAVSGGTITATPSNSSLPIYSGTDTAAVFNNVTTQLATVGGRLFFKNGVYPVNSMTLESVGGATCSSLGGSGSAVAYAMAFPANTLAASVQWLLEGESNSVWMGEEATTTVNNAGVVFNITPTAVSSVAAGSVLMGFWQRPTANCTLSGGPGLPSNNVSNDIHYKNMTVRFPVNTRGNEIAFNSWFAFNHEYENVVADFNVPYNTLATGAAPTKGTYGSFGMTSTVSELGGWQFWKNTFASGYDSGYDALSEHIVSITSIAIYCNTPITFGRAQTFPVSHSSIFTHFNDQENGSGPIFSTGMAQGSRVDFYGYIMEVGNDANWYSTARNKQPAWSEVNQEYSAGTVTYTYVLQNVGIAVPPTLNLFTSGGKRFQTTPNTQSPNFALATQADDFVRQNGAVGPDWGNIGPTGCNNSTILNHAFTASSTFASCLYAAQTSNNDQFSQGTIGTVDANAATVAVRASGSALTYYDYLNTSNAGRAIRKRIAGTFTTLSSTASNAANGDVVELVVIGSNLFAFRNGVLDLTATDSSIASGSPGLNIGGPGNSFTNWSGGSLPVRDWAASNPRSLYSQPFFAPTYNTLTNCNPGSVVSPAACGSAASGTVVVPTTTATYTVNTTAVTANSRIIILPITDNSGLTGAPTCTAPPTPFIAYESGRTAGTSFTFVLPSTTGASCWTYWVVN